MADFTVQAYKWRDDLNQLQSDIRKLVGEYRTKQHLSDKPRGVNNLLDDIENLLDGGE